MAVELVRSFDLKIGDHFIGWGKGWTVAEEPRRTGTGDIGSAKFRAKGEVVFVNIETGERRTLAINGETKTQVIRGWAEANGVTLPLSD